MSTEKSPKKSPKKMPQIFLKIIVTILKFTKSYDTLKKIMLRNNFFV